MGWKDIDRFLNWISAVFALISLLIAVLTALGTPGKKAIWLSLFCATFLILAVVSSIRIVIWIRSRPHVEYCRNLGEAKQYKIEKLLEGLRANKIEKIEVIARTAFRLLAGDEQKYQNEPTEFEDDLKHFQWCFVEALRDGGEISFVIQNPNFGVPGFTKAENELLREQVQVAIRSHESIVSLLSENRAAGKTTLRITDMIIDNSMVRITYKADRNKMVLIRDLSIRFKEKTAHPAGDQRVEKPFLVFHGKGNESREFMEEFDELWEASQPIKAFNEELQKGLEEINIQIDKHAQCYSKLRQDQSKRLAYSAARGFINEDEFGEAIPPTCIQFLITNQCTTECSMCDHWKLHEPSSELVQAEVEQVLTAVSNAGTRAVVISGGEPLAREDLHAILKYGKHECGLHLGLITNGVCGTNMERKSVSDSMAQTIAETCRWVQVSIDSFDATTYKKIRGCDCLGLAKASLEKMYSAKKTITNALLKNVEVCYTIQKGNIQQLDSDVNKMDGELPDDVSVRLKIAHGPENGREFLLSKDGLKTLQRVLRRIYANKRFNARYILFMIENYFGAEDLCNGTPLRSKMDHEFRQKNYLCYAIRLSCLINANGDMYPCCFLFDDNHADSQIRKHSKIALNVKQNDVFLDAWYRNPKLNALRQTQLPVNTDACYYCTRYFYQNELLNEVYKKFSDYKRYGLAEAFMEQCSEGEGIDTPYWL